MTIKIDTRLAPANLDVFVGASSRFGIDMDGALRIVRESDWRKVMAVVRAADVMAHTLDFNKRPGKYIGDVVGVSVTLRKHLEKRKESKP